MLLYLYDYTMYKSRMYKLGNAEMKKECVRQGIYQSLFATGVGVRGWCGARRLTEVQPPFPISIIFCVNGLNSQVVYISLLSYNYIIHKVVFMICLSWNHACNNPSAYT